MLFKRMRHRCGVAPQPRILRWLSWHSTKQNVLYALSRIHSMKNTHRMETC